MTMCLKPIETKLLDMDKRPILEYFDYTLQVGTPESIAFRNREKIREWFSYSKVKDNEKFKEVFDELNTYSLFVTGEPLRYEVTEDDLLFVKIGNIKTYVISFFQYYNDHICLSFLDHIKYLRCLDFVTNDGHALKIRKILNLLENGEDKKYNPFYNLLDYATIAIKQDYLKRLYISTTYSLDKFAQVVLQIGCKRFEHTIELNETVIKMHLGEYTQKEVLSNEELLLQYIYNYAVYHYESWYPVTSSKKFPYRDTSYWFEVNRIPEPPYKPGINLDHIKPKTQQR